MQRMYLAILLFLLHGLLLHKSKILPKTNDFDKKICNNLKVYTEDYAIYNGSLGWHNGAMAEHLLYNKPGLNDQAL